MITAYYHVLNPPVSSEGLTTQRAKSGEVVLQKRRGSLKVDYGQVDESM